MNKVYTFKFWQEAGWTLGVTMLVYVLTAFIQGEGVTDWHAWGLAVLLGAARSGAGALLSLITKPDTGDETDA